MVPQGCPLAPATLLVWMTAGFRYTEARLQNTSHFLTKIWTTEVPAAQLRIRQWHAWSQRVGLTENSSKTQGIAVVSTANLPGFVPPATVLGATTSKAPACRGFSSTGHGSTSSVLSPVTAGRAGFLQSVPWMAFFRASPGRATSHQHRASNPSLRSVLFGGALHLDVKLACNLFARLCRRRFRCLNLKRENPETQPLVSWQNRAATALGLLRRWLRQQGWQESQPWT